MSYEKTCLICKCDNVILHCDHTCCDMSCYCENILIKVNRDCIDEI